MFGFLVLRKQCDKKGEIMERLGIVSVSKRKWLNGPKNSVNVNRYAIENRCLKNAHSNVSSN